MIKYALTIFLFTALSSYGAELSMSNKLAGSAGLGERGETFEGLATRDVISKLAKSKDKIERQKLAKVIGDRSIAGTLELSKPEAEQVRLEILGLLDRAKSSDTNERSEAKSQIERMWRAGVPTLIEHISPSNNVASVELAVKSLILMRDENVVTNLINDATLTQDPQRRQFLVFTLSQMKEKRSSNIPGRTCLGEKESEELYTKFVTPALEKLK